MASAWPLCETTRFPSKRNQSAGNGAAVKRASTAECRLIAVRSTSKRTVDSRATTIIPGAWTTCSGRASRCFARYSAAGEDAHYSVDGKRDRDNHQQRPAAEFRGGEPPPTIRPSPAERVSCSFQSFSARFSGPSGAEFRREREGDAARAAGGDGAIRPWGGAGSFHRLWWAAAIVQVSRTILPGRMNNVFWQHGRHSVKFGGEILQTQIQPLRSSEPRPGISSTPMALTTRDREHNDGNRPTAAGEHAAGSACRFQPLGGAKPHRRPASGFTPPYIQERFPPSSQIDVEISGCATKLGAAGFTT